MSRVSATKLKDVGKLLPQVFSPSFPRTVVSWYHAKYVASNRINPFFHVFIALSAFGWYMHESTRAQGRKRKKSVPPLTCARCRRAVQAATDTRRR